MNNDDINRFFLFTSADPGVLDLGFKFASWGMGEGVRGSFRSIYPTFIEIPMKMK